MTGLDLTCSIRNPCTPTLDCNNIGSSLAAGFYYSSNFRIPSVWGYYALDAIKNINQQLSNTYQEMKDAFDSLALDAFQIDDFFPKKDASFLLNGLTGLSTIFSVIGGFIPGVGELVTGAGAIAGGVGGVLGNSISSGTGVLATQKTFVSKVKAIYANMTSTFEDTSNKLLKGDTISSNFSSFNITDMMRGGNWVGPDVLSNVSDLHAALRKEFLSRSIDALWKTFPSNKNWVLFVDLGDGMNSTSKCEANNTGPSMLKYCADGGVYYAYNFVEKDYSGHADLPWGADKLQETFDIIPAVRVHCHLPFHSSIMH